MPGYLIRHARGQREDVLIEDPGLHVTFIRGWVVFTEGEPHTEGGTVVLAIPTEQVASVQRVDDTPEATAEE
ncbi:hypothetical protein ACLIYM_25210 [Streptomyces fenghuangensis]